MRPVLYQGLERANARLNATVAANRERLKNAPTPVESRQVRRRIERMKRDAIRAATKAIMIKNRRQKKPATTPVNLVTSNFTEGLKDD